MISRVILIILLISISFSCGFVNSSLNFSFLDTEKNIYNTNSLNKDFAINQNIDFNPNIVLMLVDTTSNDQYIEQMSNLYRIRSAEERAIIFVTASRDQSYHSGYFTDEETTLAISTGRVADFHVILLSNTGRILKESDRPFSPVEIERAFPVLPQASDNP